MNYSYNAFKEKMTDLAKRRQNRSFVGKLTTYALLIIFGFVFAYPLVYLILQSVMPPEDLFNPVVNMVPSVFTMDNYARLFKKFNYWGSLGYTTYLAGVSSLLQTASCGLMGYGLSRYQFKLKPVYLVLVIASFIIPQQVLMIPTYMQYSNLGLLGNVLSFFLPAAFGQGLKSPIFILIFFSFFNTIPKSLDEAAQIDGASALGTFAKILLPLAFPAVMLTFIFSLVWYWNENYLTALYIGSSAKTILSQVSIVLSNLESEALKESTEMLINVPIRMAATFLTIVPLLLFYFVMQRQFVESIDRSGITGE